MRACNRSLLRFSVSLCIRKPTTFIGQLQLPLLTCVHIHYSNLNRKSANAFRTFELWWEHTVKNSQIHPDDAILTQSIIHIRTFEPNKMRKKCTALQHCSIIHWNIWERESEPKKCSLHERSFWLLVYYHRLKSAEAINEKRCSKFVPPKQSAAAAAGSSQTIRLDEHIIPFLPISVSVSLSTALTSQITFHH